jgi:hypothetical protein
MIVPKAERGQDLRDDDEEVEDAHVDAGLPGGRAPARMAYGMARVLAQAIPTPTMGKSSRPGPAADRCSTSPRRRAY